MTNFRTIFLGKIGGKRFPDKKSTTCFTLKSFKCRQRKLLGPLLRKDPRAPPFAGPDSVFRVLLAPSILCQKCCRTKVPWIIQKFCPELSGHFSRDWSL